MRKHSSSLKVARKAPGASAKNRCIERFEPGVYPPLESGFQYQAALFEPIMLILLAESTDHPGFWFITIVNAARGSFEYNERPLRSDAVESILKLHYRLPMNELHWSRERGPSRRNALMLPEEK